jgi:predicted dinucleotide-binding enzyme
MKIGIIGSGNMGAALGKKWSLKGHEVKFSFTKDSEKLLSLSALNNKTSSGSVEEAIIFADVLMLALPYQSLPEFFKHSHLLEGKTIISCVSGLKPDFVGETVGIPTNMKNSVAEQIAEIAPNSAVVEAFNTTFAEILALPFDELKQLNLSVFYCGEDAEAKKTAAILIEDCGYNPINSGGIMTARSLETFASVWVQLAVVSGLFPRIGIKGVQF